MYEYVVFFFATICVVCCFLFVFFFCIFTSKLTSNEYFCNKISLCFELEGYVMFWFRLTTLSLSLSFIYTVLVNDKTGYIYTFRLFAYVREKKKGEK